MDNLNAQKLIDDAILCFTLGEELNAKNILLDVLKVEPKNLNALRAISEVFLSLNDLKSSESYCRQALNIDSEDLTTTVSLARILVKQGDKEGAEDASSKARILGWKEELASDGSDEVQSK